MCAHTLPAGAGQRCGSYLTRVDVVPLAAADGSPSGAVNVTIALPSEGGGTGDRAVGVFLGWDCDASAPGCARGGAPSVHPLDNGTIRLVGVKVPNPRTWQPEANPTAAPRAALHNLTVRLASGGDALTVRFGLRVVAAAGRSILLNGKKIKLKGFNRHEMYPQVGPSVPASLWAEDLDWLQLRMHGNFIRGSHYPQDGRFLDLCDERGVLVWDEALAWGNWMQQLVDPLFMAAELATGRAMLRTAMNHPSVVLWGFFNEGDSANPNSASSYRAMAELFHADRSRLVTWADNRLNHSLMLEFADIISFNSYPGWYGGDASSIVHFWQTQAAWVAENWPHKPFIISEAGAGAVAGNHSASQARWSEEYQATVDDLTTGVAVNDSRIAGISLWQFSDIKVDQANTSSGRPGGINNKGVLTRDRQPKLSVARVAANYARA